MADVWDVAVLGAGAAGMMAAIEAGKRGRKVVVLDHAERVGKKILISGGGRCNFTNLNTTPANFLSANPHFAKSALARFTPQDFVALVEKHGIAYHHKTLGQLFCDRAAQEIVDLLMAEARDADVTVQLQTAVRSVTRGVDAFAIETHNSVLHARAVIVATGGLSIPKMGATGVGYDIARSFGLAIEETRAALVPLVFAPEDAERWCDLSGVSAEVVASAPGSPYQPPRRPQVTFREKLLLTHRGVSGPAVLQISSYWKPRMPVEFDLAPGQTVFDLMLAPDAIRTPEAMAYYLRDTSLPQRFATRWVKNNTPARWRNHDMQALEEKLHRWRVVPAGTEGYAKAEVTAGGISTTELDSTTMEAKKVPGLFFIGEVVDVTGHLGGFNFQWAWASGAAAGRAV
ncbi:MAG: NAD(P)/FAD-dependent oxidoreductase [Acidobacteria bacterium]|nr:NAD(P)/FAD-dependent oxidoreductase [Acidobacteriota bacterium]